jgi:hypothetical protein
MAEELTEYIDEGRAVLAQGGAPVRVRRVGALVKVEFGSGPWRYLDDSQCVELICALLERTDPEKLPREVKETLQRELGLALTDLGWDVELPEAEEAEAVAVEEEALVSGFPAPASLEAPVVEVEAAPEGTPAPKGTSNGHAEE